MTQATIKPKNSTHYTTIQIDVWLKRELDKLKIHPRESYNNVIKRILKEVLKNREEIKTDPLSIGEEWRINVLKRDKFICVVCGKPCNSAHHIYSRLYCQKHNPELEWDLRNGVSACYGCHEQITQDGRKWFNR